MKILLCMHIIHIYLNILTYIYMYIYIYLFITSYVSILFIYISIYWIHSNNSENYGNAVIHIHTRLMRVLQPHVVPSGQSKGPSGSCFEPLRHFSAFPGNKPLWTMASLQSPWEGKKNKKWCWNNAGLST